MSRGSKGRTGAFLKDHWIGSAASACAVVLGLAIALGQWLLPRSPPEEPDVSTLVTVFNGSAGNVTPFEKNYAVGMCANQSMVSVRFDARACVFMRVRKDPCFIHAEERSEIAVCPWPGQNTEGALAFHVGKTVNVDKLWGRPHVPESLDAVVAEGYPWAIRISGSEEWCTLDPRRDSQDTLGDALSNNYVCMTSQLELPVDPEVFFSKLETSYLRFVAANQQIVNAVSRNSNGHWTGQMITTETGLSTTVEISDVEF